MTFLSLFGLVNVAQAEVSVSTSGITHTCSVDIWKEIYNNNFQYWADNMPGNWRGNPYSGYTDTASEWQKKRMCLQVAIKKMAESSNAVSLEVQHPNEYMITASMYIEDDTKVFNCNAVTETQGCNQKGTLIGTGGRFSVMYRTDSNGNYNGSTFYIPNVADTASGYTLEDGSIAHGYTGDNNTNIHNLHYFHIEDINGNALIHANMGSSYWTSTLHTEIGMFQ